MSHLAQNARAAVYSGCGAGKTVVVATTLAESLFDALETRRWLVVAPKSVAEDTWQREFGKWAHLSYIKPRLLTFTDLGMRRAAGGGLEFSDRAAVKARICQARSPVDVCDYGMLQWLVKATGVNWPYDGVVFDESGFLRDTQSLRFRAAKHAVNRLHVVKRVIELDGTPLPARYENLLAPFMLLDRGDRLGATKTEFRQRWCEPDVVGRDGQIFSWKIRRDQIEPIQEKVRELAVSSDRDIGVELVESDHVVKLPADVRRIYDQMEHDMIVTIDGESILAANSAVMANKLLQVCNGFIFDGDRRVRRLHELKIEAIAEAVEAMDRPVLLAYLFVPDGVALAKRLGKRLRMANEPGAKDQFRAGELPVLAFHPDSMSHGIDGLQGASNTVLWCGSTYRFDWYHQVFKRLHRDGQLSDTVFVRRFVTEGTIEPRIIREVLIPRGEQNNGLLRALRP